MIASNIMTESLCFLRNVIETWDVHSSIIVCLEFWADWYILSYMHCWWSWWGVMAASHCDSWWRWWSGTLWVALTMLWPDSFLWCLFWFGWSWHNGYIQVSLQSFLCNLIDVFTEQTWFPALIENCNLPHSSNLHPSLFFLWCVIQHNFAGKDWVLNRCIEVNYSSIDRFWWRNRLAPP